MEALSVLLLTFLILILAVGLHLWKHPELMDQSSVQPKKNQGAATSVSKDRKSAAGADTTATANPYLHELERTIY
jgi:hypothetical protein